MPATRLSDARHHHAHTLIAAHRVYGDMRLAGHIFPLNVSGPGSGPDSDDFAAVIMAACRAKMVRALQFATVGAFLERLHFQRIVAAAHAALGWRCFPLRDSHIGTCIRICKQLMRQWERLCTGEADTEPIAQRHPGCREVMRL